MPDPNIALMTSIRAKWGAAITAACASSSVKPEFLAALIANESGGNPDAKRFEKNVLAQLWEVLQGRQAAFGSIGRNDLILHCSAVTLNALTQIDQLATSWGLTQIMGYETIALGVPISTLQSAAPSLPQACRMLGEFAERYQFDVASDFTDLFNCWNTGRPKNMAATTDARYIPNGLARAQIYAGLPAVAPGSGG
jgi:hypothetical protein